MSFLSKLGSIFKSTGTVITKLAPLTPVVAGFLPTGANGKVMDIFNGSVAIVGQTEAMFEAINAQKSGPDKLKASLPMVAGLVQQSEFMIDKTIIDPVQFEAGLVDLTNAIVKITKSVNQISPEQVNERIQTAVQEHQKLQGQGQGNYGMQAPGLIRRQ